MSKKFASKIIAFISLLMCLLLVSNSIAIAADSNNDFFTVDSISIDERHGIPKGKTVQLTATLSPENAVSSAVTWSSSKPDVISCTEDGVIKGVKAGDYADITCKAKFGSAEDKIRVYCVEPVTEASCDFEGYITYIYASPSYWEPVALHFNYQSILKYMFGILMQIPGFGNLPLRVSAPSSVLDHDFTLASGKCVVQGRYKSYAYIAFAGGDRAREGFVRYSELENVLSDFLGLTPIDMDVWGNGYVNSDKKLTTSYKGDITWTVGDSKIVKFDSETKQVVGLKPGTTKITALADGMSATCTIHSLYRWPQTWSTKTNRQTYLYRAEGSEYKTKKYLAEGKAFTVYGDNGTSDGWAYGKTNINGIDYWGYIPISHVSTKGTVSFYSNLGWSYPLLNEAYNYIYSPFAPRSSQSDEHRGMDINEKPKQSDIEGQKLVAVFDGVVKDAGYNSSAGYYVCITSKYDVDIVTGEKLIAIYMHMRDMPLVSAGDEVEKGKTNIGYVGNTGGSTGSHLHFEANNKNAVVDDEIRKSYTYTINPIYFFKDRGFEFNEGCSAFQNGYGFYWYDYNK